MPTIHKTRFSELGYVKDAPGLWRFVTTEDGSRVGSFYPTKAELLADLERYATEYGCNGPANAQRAADIATVRGYIAQHASVPGANQAAREAFERLHS